MEEKLIELNSHRVKSIAEFTTNIHNLTAELYESLIDGDDESSKKNSNEIIKNLKSLKFN